MARRVVMGRMTDGSFDLRISRRGYDAMTSDANDFKRVSFSAVRQARAKVASTGFAAVLGQWVGFGKTFAAPPPVLASLRRGGQMHFNWFFYAGDKYGVLGYANPFCFVVQESQLKIAPTAFQNVSLDAGDRLMWFALEN
jgi:hypothetical protein